MVPLFNVLTMRGSVAELDSKTVPIFAYSRAREQSDVWGERTSRFATLNQFWEKKKNPTVLQSIAEWSASRTRNPAVPGSSPALTTCWICSRLF